MRSSLIINTGCGYGELTRERNPFRSASYVSRYELLHDKILPQVIEDGWDEVFVCGGIPIKLAEDFGDKVKFLHLRPVRRDRWDGLFQREAGARNASGDILAFCHDDHMPCKPPSDEVKELMWDILVPRRLHGITGAELNNGKADDYMGGHCYLMKRWIWAAYPLTNAPDEWWDLFLSKIWRSLGASIVWTDLLHHIDLEAAADET